MGEDMQKETVDIAIAAFEKHNVEKDVAEYIKKEFDKKHGPTWHCIVGKNFEPHCSWLASCASVGGGSSTVAAILSSVFFFLHFFIFSSSFPPPPIIAAASVLYIVVRLFSTTIPLVLDLADLSIAVNWWPKVIATCSSRFIHGLVRVSLLATIVSHIATILMFFLVSESHCSWLTSSTSAGGRQFHCCRNIVWCFLFLHFFIFSSSFPLSPIVAAASVLYIVVRLRSTSIPLVSDLADLSNAVNWWFKVIATCSSHFIHGLVRVYLADLSNAVNWWFKVIATCSSHFIHGLVRVSLHCHYRGFYAVDILRPLTRLDHCCLCSLLLPCIAFAVDISTPLPVMVFQLFLLIFLRQLLWYLFV
ncbi:dynein light chain type 1 family protein [Actinidia rufa]|uniref:Dynein light chain 1, cytoplasmic n=1 Tax=Actinidia rufa TaxID=165716 RepID=A0A7J0GTW3_9ERIC|nr:dynein light chain type 1 family protein [Actinidia rufa]